MMDRLQARARQAVLGWLVKRGGVTVEQGNGVSWLSSIMGAWMGGQKSSSGVYINEETALRISAVFTSVRIIGGTIGSLPLHVYRRTDDGGREIAARHWAYPLLHDAPSADHTAFTWRELMLAHNLLWGNAYSRIEWLRNGAAGELLPLMPWDVTPRKTKRGTKYYEVHLSDGYEDLPADEVIHVPGVSYDGMKGMSVIEKMRDALGIAKAAEDLVGSFFANGAKVGGILEVPGKMDPAAQQNLVQSLADKFNGKEGAFKSIVLEEGAKFHGPNMMPLKDAQMLESRKFSRSEIFGWYGVPPHLGGDSEKSTSWGTGIEQMDIGYAKHTITPWCTRIEQELNRKLFVRGSGLYCKFNLDALMRGAFKDRMEGLQIAVGGPWISRNEARELEDLNKSSEEGMDKVLTALNMGAGATPPAPKADPAGTPPADGGGDGGDGGDAGDEENARRSAPAVVHVTVENHMPSQSAPEVHVAAPQVHVAAPNVQVKNEPHITVKQPGGRSVTRFERDHNGDLKMSVTENREAGE